MASPSCEPNAPRGHALPPHRSLTVRMDVTNRCNLDCIHCTLALGRERAGESPADMPVELFARIAAQVFPYARMVALSCEAEPMMHGRFGDLLEVIEATPGPDYVMTTNGTMLTPRRLRAIVAAGMAAINVSMDGSTPETFARIRRPGRLDRVLAAIAAIDDLKRELGRSRGEAPALQINTTLMQSTVRELPDLVELCGRHNVARLTVQHLYATDDTGLWAESLVGDAETSDRILRQCAERCRDLGIATTFPPLFLEPPAPAPAAKVDDVLCAAPWTMLRILWNGHVQPCDHWQRRPYGDLASQSFEEIWSGPIATALRRDHAARSPSHESCATCAVVTTDNLEGRALASPIPFTAAMDPERYVELALATLSAAEAVGSDAWWGRLRPLVDLLGRDPGVPPATLARSWEARSWELVAAAVDGARHPATWSSAAALCHLGGRRDLAATLMGRYISAPVHTLPRSMLEETHLRLAYGSALRGDHEWADTQARAALLLGTSASGAALLPAPDFVGSNIDSILAACRRSNTLSTLANVRLLRTDLAGARLLFARYLDNEPTVPDAASIAALVARLTAELCLVEATAAARRRDVERALALTSEALAVDPGPPFLDPRRAGATDLADLARRVRHPTTLLGLGALLRELNRREGAALMLERYRAVAPDAPNRAQVEATIVELRRPWLERIVSRLARVGR